MRRWTFNEMLPGIGYWNPTLNFETHLPCNNIYENNNAYKCQGTQYLASRFRFIRRFFTLYSNNKLALGQMAKCTWVKKWHIKKSCCFPILAKTWLFDYNIFPGVDWKEYMRFSSLFPAYPAASGSRPAACSAQLANHLLWFENVTIFRFSKHIL